MKQPVPTLRGDTYWLRRRVPKRFQHLEARTFVHVSLNTDSEREAIRKAAEVWDQTMAAWQALSDGQPEVAADRVAAARSIAKAHHVRYLPMERVAELPLDELLARIERAVNPKTGTLDPVKADAFLGSTEGSKISMSQAWPIYLDLTKASRDGKTKNQLRVWRAARERAMRRAEEALGGDIELASLSADDVLDIREFFYELAHSGQISLSTANKEMGYIWNVIRTVAQLKRLPVALDTKGMAFPVKGQNTRPPFSDEWIKEKLLAPGALDGMNSEARGILLVMVHTGMRPSEVDGLHSEDIRLDTDIPHVDINDRHRPLKTAQSVRIIPLVGVSLEALRAHRDGFPRYREKGTVSAAVNSFLAENDLRETPAHSLYSLRHSFEDRLLAADIDERIRRDLMGHKLLNRERYGAGARLEKLHKILNETAKGWPK